MNVSTPSSIQLQQKRAVPTALQHAAGLTVLEFVFRAAALVAGLLELFHYISLKKKAPVRAGIQGKLFLVKG